MTPFFGTFDDYALMTPCGRCQAKAGTPCVGRTGRAKFHVQRQAAGANNLAADMDAAPAIEDLEPGRSYTSLRWIPTDFQRARLRHAKGE